MRIVFVFITLLLAACGQPAPAPDTATIIPVTPTTTPVTYEGTLPMFDYDSSNPFDVKIASEEQQDGVIVQELSYQASNPGYIPLTKGRIVALLVRPANDDGEGEYAGILYQHGYGNPWGDRKAFLDEAVGLARRGVVSLLPMGLFPWHVRHTGDGPTDQANIIKQVRELRRSLDFLLLQPGVDAARIAYVGADYGAMHGALLAGVEKRIKTYVLIAGDNNYSDWAINYLTKPADPDAFRASMAVVDPIVFVPHAAPATLFFQSNGNDRFVPKAAADLFFEAASEPKKLGWYPDVAHTFDEQADKDRLDWLAAELGLQPAP